MEYQSQIPWAPACPPMLQDPSLDSAKCDAVDHRLASTDGIPVNPHVKPDKPVEFAHRSLASNSAWQSKEMKSHTHLDGRYHEFSKMEVYGI